jgi:hypothetical protein
MYRIFNLPPQQILRTGTFFNSIHPDFNSIHPEDRGNVVKALGNALVGKEPFNIEHRIIWPDGAVRSVRGKAEVSFDEGRPVRVLVTVQDITDNQQIRRFDHRLLDKICPSILLPIIPTMSFSDDWLHEIFICRHVVNFLAGCAGRRSADRLPHCRSGHITKKDSASLTIFSASQINCPSVAISSGHLRPAMRIIRKSSSKNHSCTKYYNDTKAQ